MEKKFEFTPKQWVLTRDSGDVYSKWTLDIFSHVEFDADEGCNHYQCVGGWDYDCIPYNDDTAHLIGTTDDYVEPYVPKDGDFVYVKSILTGTEYVFIKKDFDGCSLTSHWLLFDVEENALSRVYETCTLDKDIEEIRLATDSEKQLLLDALHKEGKDWDPEKKKIVELKWKPKEKGYYWTIYGDGSIDCISKVTESDAKHIEIGNCFRTKEEAQTMVDKIKKLLKGE